MGEYFDQQLVQALEISIKASLDMTHQCCPGFIMVTVGMVVGIVPLQVGKEDVTNKVLDPPFGNFA